MTPNFVVDNKEEKLTPYRDPFHALLCSPQMATAYKEEVGPKVDGLLELQKALRKTPSVVLDTPACVLVGAPNVGKR